MNYFQLSVFLSSWERWFCKDWLMAFFYNTELYRHLRSINGLCQAKRSLMMDRCAGTESPIIWHSQVNPGGEVNFPKKDLLRHPTMHVHLSLRMTTQDFRDIWHFSVAQPIYCKSRKFSLQENLANLAIVLFPLN